MVKPELIYASPGMFSRPFSLNAVQQPAIWHSKDTRFSDLQGLIDLASDAEANCWSQLMDNGSREARV